MVVLHDVKTDATIRVEERAWIVINGMDGTRDVAGLAAYATADDDIDRYVELDRRFYDALAQAAHNALLAEVVPRIFNLHLRLWFFISKKIGSWHPIAEAHEVMTRAVVEALRRRDADAAELAMRVYISRRHQDIREVL